MQHERNESTPSGPAGPNREQPKEGFIPFVVVQKRVRLILEEIGQKVSDDLVVPEGHQEEARRLIASRFAEVELEGVRAVALLRQLRGDEAALRNWEEHARRVMIRKLVRLFGDQEIYGGALEDGSDDDHGDGAPIGSDHDGPKLNPSGGVVLAVAGAAGDVRLPAVAHPNYLATTADVGRFVYCRALAVTRARVRSWSDDSGEPEAIAAAATMKVLGRYQRLWNPDEGSLLAYLGASVRWTVKDEYILACKRKANRKSLTEEYEQLLAEDLRSRAGSTEQDLRIEGLAGELEHQRYVERLEILVNRLNTHQRNEFDRRRRENTPGTPDQQSTYSRALRNLRSMAA